MSDMDKVLNKNNYNKKYYLENKEKWTDKSVCEDCGNAYNLNNKYYHFKSKKHANALILKKKEQDILKLKEQLSNSKHI